MTYDLLSFPDHFNNLKTPFSPCPHFLFNVSLSRLHTAQTYLFITPSSPQAIVRRSTSIPLTPQCTTLLRPPLPLPLFLTALLPLPHPLTTDTCQGGRPQMQAACLVK
jgi:hypothetical protein